MAEIFEKVSFDPYNFRITRLSARKSAEQMKNFYGIKICLYLPLNAKIRLTLVCLSGFELIFSLGAPVSTQSSSRV